MVGAYPADLQHKKPFERHLTLTAVDNDERVFDIRSRIESQYKSQDPRHPHDNRQFQHNQGQVSLVCSGRIALTQKQESKWILVLSI